VFSANLRLPDGMPVLPADLLKRLDGLDNLNYRFLDQPSAHITGEHIADASILVQSGLIVDDATFALGAERLAAICLFSLGFDTVDIAACTRAGVAVTRTRGISKHTVASGALTLILALGKRLMDKQRIAQGGQWKQKRGQWGHDIEGQTLGIVGLGDIGRELVRLVAPFQMRVLITDPYVDDAVFDDLGVERTSLPELLATSDFVSLHCNLTDETRGMIGEGELRQMKPTAYLVNTARGPVVRQDALVRALTENWIAGAGIDVFEVEPLPADDPLIGLDNAILTPHTIGASHESVRRGSEMIIDQITSFARGRIPDHVINPEVLDDNEFARKLGMMRH